MTGYELVVRGGMVAAGGEARRCDVGVRAGRIAAVGEDLSTEGAAVVEADGLLVLPGGVDTHCHIEEPQSDGSIHEESFTTASHSAFAGGTTTLVCFTPQFKGGGILAQHRANRERAARGMIDHGFHQVITDPTPAVMEAELPQVVADGVGSLKAFLTYDPLHLTDAEFLQVLLAARRHGLMVHVHCENHDAIRWRQQALLAAGMTAPKYHAWARPPVVEREATHRAIALAELVDQPIQVFHVSCAEVAEEIARAQARGLKVWGETCPQYLVLTAEDMDRPGFEGAKFICSPAPRQAADHEGTWEMLRRGTLSVVSSDHCGFSFGGDRGKARNGRDASFDAIPNGIPGLAARVPVLFSEGVSKGRIDLARFVSLTATEPARIAGLAHRKGAIAPGLDADLVLWDPAKEVTITNALMRHAIDYTPYEGLAVKGWPVITIARGEVAMREGAMLARPGSGRWLPRDTGAVARPLGHLPDGFEAAPPLP
ncbi:Dihydropyrimidinase [Roseomonas mucosa]|uniref:D-hydantoinase n=1 Tax=Roseomonas mucosa TaxID=207340 RepID=A0A379MXI0_9PROT|nr:MULTISPECIES: dihydropyrimidinase [Roseomonas]MBS5903351.1 dihydropyrimidinase [Acetobacteraceae bacterium]MCG7351774.1 dihydropyrimidinase [Roseomonas mucosa]MCG7357082.1 dihydropyrimidinase [Roseomonas mucosa]MDT8289401.1 dihydropyrimidinase [Roseomonas mucosa]MDT8295345.1 dihydropyrimidinase [Roseomonas mucosa]